MDHVDTLITLYCERLSLQSATFSRIDHNDAMVAIVYKVTLPSEAECILKICERSNDYLREVYFLKHFASTLPVPQIIEVVQPEPGLHGAILMEYLPGSLLKTKDMNDVHAYEIGSYLARIHLNRTAGYGDLIQPHSLSTDVRLHFTQKFEEGFHECSSHLPKKLLELSRHYYDTHIDLLKTADGPCITHRDFRPGNIIVYNGKIQGIIDWASARASFAEEDFCPLEHGEWQAYLSYKKAYLAGYASIRPVPEYSAMMPLLRISRAFATIGFTVKRKTWNSSHVSVYQYNYQFLETFFKSLSGE